MTDETQAHSAETETPAVARDLAARAVRTARERAEAIKAGAEKATAQIESGLTAAAATLADASRSLQGALYDDVTATLGAVEKIAAAKTLAEAAQLHTQYLSERSQVALARMAKASTYLAGLLQNGARRAAPDGQAA